MAAFIAGKSYYLAFVILMMLGLYVVFASGNMVKRLVGLSVFQTSVFLFYVALGKISGGQPPILVDDAHGGSHGGGHDAESHAAPALRGAAEADEAGRAADAAHGAAHAAEAVIYSNPLPHVLILTAIVVGVATLAVGLALVVRIREAYGSIEDEDVEQAENMMLANASDPS